MNQIFTHPGQDQMQVEVILASQGPDHKPIYTIRMRYPRIIHGEIMTHRVFSRNARSSRAVPVKTMLLETTTIPFVPWHWGKNQKGMQASEECNELVRMELITQSKGEPAFDREFTFSRENAWHHAKAAAVKTAKAYMDAGYHKQIPNRLLEPFSWIDTLVTATEWDNFLWLRDHGDAEPHLQDLARLVHKAIEAAEIQKLEPGEWHLPYITKEDRVASIVRPYKEKDTVDEWLCKISAARCARISYKPFDGDASYERELERYNLLVGDPKYTHFEVTESDGIRHYQPGAYRVHASPLEHQATPDRLIWERTIQTETEFGPTLDNPEGEAWENSHLHGNLTGYVQFRKTVANEAKMSGVVS